MRMKAKELRQLSVEKLQERVIEYRKKFQDLRFKLAAGKLKNINQVSMIKKEIARTLTILNEKKNEREKEKK